MSMQKKQPKSRNAKQAETRKAGVKVQSSVKAGSGHHYYHDPNNIGGRSSGPG